MKRFSFLLLALVWAAAAHGAEIPTTSKVTAVTVFRNMARETRTATATLPAGNSEVVLTDVSLEMLDPSILVSVKGDAVLLSASVRTNHFEHVETAVDPKVLRLQDSIEALNKRIRWITEERSVHAGELTLLDALLRSGAVKNDYKPADLTACADIYRTRTMELKKLIFDLQLRSEALGQKIEQYENQLLELGPKERNPTKEIVLNFWSEIPLTAGIKCNYLVQNAGWIPAYDLNVENTARPVMISYKANVYQQTGYEWKNVDLTISTSTPALNNDRPILSPRYVDFVTYALTPATSNGVAMNNMYIATNITNIGGGTPTFPTLVLGQYEVNEDEKDIHVEYAIELKQSVPSDGHQHICNLKKYEVPATYRYHTVPKLDLGVFLLARITEYGQYNLLAGNANVFFQDTYVGQVVLNPQVTGDTLLVSLGRDEKIVVKRTLLEEKSGKKLLGTKQKESYAYTITVRNNKGIPIQVEVLDQVPIAKNEDIKVTVEEKSGAQYVEKYGRILWNWKLDPNKSKTAELIYTIEYPEGKTISEQ